MTHESFYDGHRGPARAVNQSKPLCFSYPVPQATIIGHDLRRFKDRSLTIKEDECQEVARPLLRFSPDVL
jgi:hypothetical protein